MTLEFMQMDSHLTFAAIHLVLEGTGLITSSYQWDTELSNIKGLAQRLPFLSDRRLALGALNDVCTLFNMLLRKATMSGV